MFLGASPFTYAFLEGLVVLAAIIMSLVDLYQTSVLRIRMMQANSYANIDQSTAVEISSVPLLFYMAWIAAATGIGYYWFNGVALADRNFKVIYLISVLSIYLAPATMDLFTHMRYIQLLQRGGLRARNAGTKVINFMGKAAGYKNLAGETIEDVALGTTQKSETNNPADPVEPARDYATINYVAQMAALAAHTIMGVACINIGFNGGANQPVSNVQVATSVNGGLILMLLFIEGGRVYGSKGAWGKSTRELYKAMIDANHWVIKDISIAPDLSKFSGQTVKLAQTGDATYPADDPMVALAKHIESRVAREGHSYGLSVKNYAAIQDGFSNKFLITTQQKAATLLSQDAPSKIHRAKYGLLAPATESEAKEPNTRDQNVDDILKKRAQQMPLVPILNRMYHNEPACLRFYHAVCGFGIGYGNWFNLSNWFPWVFLLYVYTINIQVLRDGGAGAAMTWITMVPTLLLSWYGYDGQWPQLNSLGQLYGVGFIIFTTYLGASNQKYIMSSAVIGDDTAGCLQDVTCATIGDDWDAQFTAYFSLCTSIVFVLLSTYNIFARDSED